MSNLCEILYESVVGFYRTSEFSHNWKLEWLNILVNCVCYKMSKCLKTLKSDRIWRHIKLSWNSFILFFSYFFNLTKFCFFINSKIRGDRWVSGLAYFRWCCQMQSDISIGKIVIFQHNGTRQVFKVWASFLFVFPLRLKHLQNIVFEHYNSIFWWRKSLTTHFFHDVRE